MSVVEVDVAEFQPPLDHTYVHDFVTFRGTFGASYLDHRFLANAAACKAMYAGGKGKLAGGMVYTVYLSSVSPQAQAKFLIWALGPKPPDWLAGIMIDVEAWRGTGYPIYGDHSAQINTLYGLLAHYMGSYRAVIAYGNRSDLAAIYPHRDPRCRVIVASYGSAIVFRSVRGAIGQQYSDGQGKWGAPRGLPISSAPFGHCDHNVFPDFANGKALRASLRPAPVAVKPPPIKPSGPPAPVLYPAGRPSYLVSPDRKHAVFLTNGGRLEIHTGHHLDWHN